jgi:hypothetical protein
MLYFISLNNKKKMGLSLETWVFVAILVLAGFLVITCGLKEPELSFAFIAVEITTASLSSLVLVRRFRKLLSRI